MRTEKTRTLSMWLAVALGSATAMAGCASDNPSDPAAAGCEGGTIKVGLLTSVTGAQAFLGDLGKKGAETAVQVIKDNGGLLKCDIQLVTRDDQGDPAQAVSAARELIERERVDVMLSVETSGNSLAISPFVNQGKIVNLVGLGTADALYDVKKFPYNFGFSIVAGPQATAAADHAKQLGLTRAVFAIEDSAYGDGITKATVPAMKGAGVADTGVVRWAAEASNLDGSALKIKNMAANADFVYVCGTPPGSARLVQSFKKVGLDVPIQGCTSLRGEAFLTAAGAAAQNDTVTLSVNPPQYRVDKENVKRFTDAFEKLYQRKPGDEAWIYSALTAWAQAVRAAGSTDSAKVRSELEKLKDFNGGANAPISFSADNHIALADPKAFVPIFLTSDPKANGQCGASFGGLQYCDADTLKRVGLPVPTF